MSAPRGSAFGIFPGWTRYDSGVQDRQTRARALAMASDHSGPVARFAIRPARHAYQARNSAMEARMGAFRRRDPLRGILSVVQAENCR